MLNFYNVHYAYTHIVGTSGGNNDDMKEALDIMGKGLDPAGLVTHIGGIDCVPEATINLPNLPGGKKLIYTHVNMPLTAIDDFGKLGEKNPSSRGWRPSVTNTTACGAWRQRSTCCRMPIS